MPYLVLPRGLCTLGDSDCTLMYYSTTRSKDLHDMFYIVIMIISHDQIHEPIVDTESVCGADSHRHPESS